MGFDLSPLAAFPRFSRAMRGMLAASVVGLYAFTVATAGPGNGLQPRPEPVHVTLPTVVIVGQREAPAQAMVASAAALNKVRMVR